MRARAMPTKYLVFFSFSSSFSSFSSFSSSPEFSLAHLNSRVYKLSQLLCFKVYIIILTID